MRVILDIETDGIDATKIHCVVCREVDNDRVHIFKEPNALREFSSLVTLWIGHNIITYDWYYLSKLWGITLPAGQVCDTLILSQLLKQGVDGGHSLEAWGVRLNIPKRGTGISDFSVLTPELLDRCIGDTDTNLKLYNYLLKKLHRPEWKEPIDVEHRMAFVCLGMHLDGFKYNKLDADILSKSLGERLVQLDSKLLEAFKPKAKGIREVTPRLTKHGTINKSDFRWYKGTDYTIFKEGCPFTVVEFKPFDPNSTKQITERLDEAGWKPTDKTKTGQGYKVNEVNLATLPDTAPDATRLLVERLLISSRVRTLETWQAAYSEKDGRIHGRFNTLGTYTHRMSHTKPNMGNVSAEKSIKYKGEKLKKLATDLGGQMRRLWVADDNAWLVGTDMAGAHLRILGHLMEDDDYIKSLLEGSKELGTDIHSRNRDALGIENADRDLAKTFIYTFLNGGGQGKVADIFGIPVSRAKQALEQFVNAYPGLRKLRHDLFPRWANQGWFPGCDGRLVCCDSEHLMMAAVLQNYEAVCVKHALINCRAQLKKEGIPFKTVNVVHDEIQHEVYGDYSLAEYVGQVQAEHIKKIGEYFNIRCPLAGEYSVGKTWLDTH